MIWYDEKVSISAFWQSSVDNIKAVVYLVAPNCLYGEDGTLLQTVRPALWEETGSDTRAREISARRFKLPPAALRLWTARSRHLPKRRRFSASFPKHVSLKS